MRPKNPLLVALTLPALACSSPASGPSSDPRLVEKPPATLAASKVDASAIASFGDGEQGFVSWMSSGGALAVVHVFEDTDASGAIEIQFGHHGESFGDRYRPHVVALPQVRRTPVDEILDVDPSGRWLATRTGDAITIWDGATGERLETSDWGLDPRSDANACLTPRQLTFDGLGGVWFHAEGAEALVWRSLTSAASARHDLAAPARTWRAQAVAPGWGAWLKVAADTDGSGSVDWPVQRTSCACLTCNRFARSMGYYGWSGDAFGFALLPPGGGEPIEVSGYAAPIARGAHATSDGRIVSSETGDELTPPEGCAPATGKVMSAGALAPLACAEGWVLWDPATGESVELEVELVDVPPQSAVVEGERHWVGALARDARGARLARVDLESGEVLVGEPLGAAAAATTRSGDWIASLESGEFRALSLTTGRQLSGDFEFVTNLSGNTAQVEEAGAVVDYERALIGELPSPATFTSETGCALLPAGEGDHPGVERGPWTLWCASQDTP